MKLLIQKLLILMVLSGCSCYELSAQQTIGLPYFITIQTQAPVELTSGKIEALEGVNSWHIKYNSDSMSVCDYTTEAAYLEHRCKDKDPEKAESIRKNWRYIHTEVCAPVFEEYFNKNAVKIGMKGYNNPEENMPVLVVKVKSEDPHFHTQGYTSRPFVVMECTFMDKVGHILAVFQIRAIGTDKGGNMEHLRDCYAIAGKMLSKEIVKRMRNSASGD